MYPNMYLNSVDLEKNQKQALYSVEGLQTRTFQPNASTPDLSTPDFSTMNFSTPDFSTMNF